MLFNVFGVCWVFCIFHPFLRLVGSVVELFGFPNPATTDFSLADVQTRQALVASLPYSVATLHSLFNVINTLILIWFVPVIERIVKWMVPSPKGEEEVFRLKYINRGLLSTSELSLNEAKSEVVHFGEICYKGFGYIRQAVNEKDPEKFEAINDKLVKYEAITDNIEYEIAQYLAEVSKGELSDSSTIRVKSIYKIIGEMESLGDSGEAIGRMLRRVHVHGKSFDDEMLWKLNRLMDYVEEAYKAMLENLNVGYQNISDISNASDAEYNINTYRNSLREELITNIEHDDYKYQVGVFYMDVVNELEQIGDFIINISQALLEEKNGK